MQHVWLKSRTRDVCGRFVVAVSFADGNVCANGACDRVIRVVRCRGNLVAEALRDDASCLCVKASVCKSFCVKASVCNGVCV